jgi:hypothetical protein
MKKIDKNWIQKAIKNKGALKRTALKKGLINNEKDSLSLSDLHKLEKMGGKTAKRAYLAETLRSFKNKKKYEEGGEINSKAEELKNKIELILKKILPKFYIKVWVYKNFFDDNKNIGIIISASNYEINNVEGQYPQAVSLSLDLKTLELRPQIFGGNGGQSIYRDPNMNDPKEKYLVMKSIKIPFRTPPKNEEAVLKAIEKFAENYKKAIKDNIDVLRYRDIIDYKYLIDEYFNGGEFNSDKEEESETLESKINHINNNYYGVTASKTYSDNRIQVVSSYFNTLLEIKRKEFNGSGLILKYGNTSSYVLYSNKSYYNNGGSVDFEIYKRNFTPISEKGRYLIIETLPFEKGNTNKNGNLKISITFEGLKKIKEGRKNDECDDCIMNKLFDDIRSNSELMYFGDLGEIGLGMSNAPCITYGYYYDENGKLTDNQIEDSQIFYFSEYEGKSFIDELLNNRYVIFVKAEKFEKGGQFIGKSNNSNIKEILKSDEVPTEILKKYLGRNPEYEENIKGFVFRKCYLKPFYKKIK